MNQPNSELPNSYNLLFRIIQTLRKRDTQGRNQRTSPTQWRFHKVSLPFATQAQSLSICSDPDASTIPPEEQLKSKELGSWAWLEPHAEQELQGYSTVSQSPLPAGIWGTAAASQQLWELKKLSACITTTHQVLPYHKGNKRSLGSCYLLSLICSYILPPHISAQELQTPKGFPAFSGTTTACKMEDWGIHSSKNITSESPLTTWTSPAKVLR